MNTRLSVPTLTKVLLNGGNIGYQDNDTLFKIAKRMGADTSMAERLRGRGFISDALIEAIEKRIKEMNNVTNLTNNKKIKTK